MAQKNLSAGFTGDVDDEQRLAGKAKSALARVKDEAGLVSAHAVDHPAATGSVVLAVGLLGLAVGYLLGLSAAERRGYWR
jgi:dihydropteroate synthase